MQSFACVLTGSPMLARSRLLAGLLGFTGLTLPAFGFGAALTRSGAVDYNRDIRPLLAERCFSCHGPDDARRMAGLRLDRPEGARRVLSPGSPEKSALLIRAAHPQAARRMPPPGKGDPLDAAELALLRRWIEQGAKYAGHWAYTPPSRPSLPPVRDAAWCRGPIDRFLLSRMAKAGVQPSPEAPPHVLVRRVALDLTGLPPAPEAVSAYLQDTAPAAWERLVDRLLASPAYGERMASYWFDLVRYANTVGYHGDQEHPISPYRDYVIQAFNENLPFDRFTAEQLAGDLLPSRTERQWIASGYNRLLQTTHEGGAQDREYRAKYAADRVRNLGGVWLGASTGCAECHNHKYDPISTKDFYSLAAFFSDLDELGAYRGPDATPTRRPPEIEVLSPFDRAELDAIERALAREGLSEADAEALRTRAKVLTGRKVRTMVSVAVTPRPVRVLRRGDWQDDGGELVQPAIPAFLGSLDTGARRPTRLDLARWLTRPDHPLTARVFVNRVWYLLFGSGLCRSLDDFGVQGVVPDQPELLDYLARDFADNGWDVKRLVRSIVLTSAYRQSSSISKELAAADPENRLFARQGRFRLPAEMLRDQMLAVSGLLVDRRDGTIARPYQPAGYYRYLNFPRREYQADKNESQYRRAVYVHWQRQYVHPMLLAFDAPTREECTAQRPASNTPQAALALLNDPSSIEAARVLAARLLREAPADSGRVERLLQLALSRRPTPRENDLLLTLLSEERDHFVQSPEAARKLLATGMAPLPSAPDHAELAAWTAVCRAVLNLDETVTRR